MRVRLHWFLPTNGDSHTDLSLGNAVGAHGARIDDAATNARKGDLAYMSQVARAAESLGFEAALTPTSSWCEEAWVITAALTQHTRDFKYLVAFRPGLQSPTLAAQAAATYQRVSENRLLLNVVVGGDAVEQRRYGDTIGKDSRYARADEFLAIVRELWTGEEVNFSGEWFEIEGARLLEPPAWPTVYLGGSSAAAIEVAARRADVYLTWGEPPEAVAAPEPAATAAPEPAAPVAMLSPQEHELRTKLKELREHLTQNSDYVGQKFPEQARKMHYGEIEHRSIYGEASPDDAKALAEEGIEFHPLPVLPEDRN